LALIEPMLLTWRAKRTGLGISRIQHDLRDIVNATLYVNRTGIAWEYLPHDFPPYKTVHGYFALWEKEGITEAIHDVLRGKVRRAAGRSEEPTAAILDAQTVKTSGNVWGSETLNRRRPGLLRGSFVLVDEPAEDGPALDPRACPEFRGTSVAAP
jgi:transposase